MSGTSQRLQGGQQHAQQGQLGQHAAPLPQQVQSQHTGAPADLSIAQHDDQRGWSALGMLAEVSRVFTQVERNDDPAQTQPAAQASAILDAPHSTEHFEVQQFTVDSHEVQGIKELKGMGVNSFAVEPELTQMFCSRANVA